VEERPFRIRKAEGSNPSVSIFFWVVEGRLAQWKSVRSAYGRPRVRTPQRPSYVFSYGVVVSTRDSESRDHGSNPCRRICVCLCLSHTHKKVIPDGIEPPLSDLESEVLPLHHGTSLLFTAVARVAQWKRVGFRSRRLRVRPPPRVFSVCIFS
jgi:hypothetical protein